MTDDEREREAGRMIEWDICLALVIGAFGFGYGLASRGWRRDIERLFPDD